MTRCLVISAMMMVLMIAATAAAAPAIAVDAPEYSHGTVFEGFAIVHSFVLRNTGDAELRIGRVTATCGCTATELATDRLAPGQSIDLQVLIDTTGYRGASAWVIHVDSNDPVTPRLTLRITATVTPSQPYHVSVGDMNYLFYLLIDLRNPDRYAARHLMGAINIPYEELDQWTERLPRGVLLILYDDRGDRSDLAARALIERGFNEARSLLGGFAEWTHRFGEKLTLADPSNP